MVLRPREPGRFIQFLHDAWADTTTPHVRLILTVLGGLAEFERHLIVASGEARSTLGAVAAARLAAQADTAHLRREAIARRDGGETLTDIARSYSVSHSTISCLR